MAELSVCVNFGFFSAMLLAANVSVLLMVGRYLSAIDNCENKLCDY